jgi:DNA mismatch repair ATPase MutL
MLELLVMLPLRNFSKPLKIYIIIIQKIKYTMINIFISYISHEQPLLSEILHTELDSSWANQLDCLSDNILYILSGFATCEHGQGRSSADRQFYFINKRPCDHSKVYILTNRNNLI